MLNIKCIKEDKGLIYPQTMQNDLTINENYLVSKLHLLANKGKSGSIW